MATINNFVGFETGGLEEVATILGSPTAQSSVVRTGTFALQCDANEIIQLKLSEDVADVGDDQIVGFAVRFTDLTPTGPTIFLEVVDVTPNTLISLRLATNGDLELLNSLGILVGTATTPFTVNTWHYVEVRWQKLDSGAADVFVDDVSEISVTGQDFDRGAVLDAYRFQNSFGSGITTYFDDIYLMSGAFSGTGDFLGKLTEVIGPYQKTDGGATELGDTLNVGTWAKASQTPAVEGGGNEADYTGTPLSGGMQTDSGVRSGPSGDARIDGDANIKAAKWIYRLSRGGGGGTTHEIRYGNSTDGMTNRTQTLTPATKTIVKVSVAATEVPLSTETFQIGMAVTGARDIELHEAWATLLHIASAVDLEELGAHQII